jgi:hypothetical protein
MRLETISIHGGFACDPTTRAVPPQLYGTTHTLLAHTLRCAGIEARFAESDRAEDIAAPIDATTRAVFCDAEESFRLEHRRVPVPSQSSAGAWWRQDGSRAFGCRRYLRAV